MNRPKDLNAPSRWNMRIWDDDKKEWLCQSDQECLTYYGFDITGGETTEFQGLPKWHPDRHLIWEQSTGLKDRNGKEIYEGDIVEIDKYGKFQIIWNEWACKFDFDKIGKREREEPLLSQDWEQKTEVIGNIHEKDKLVDFDRVKGGEK